MKKSPLIIIGVLIIIVIAAVLFILPKSGPQQINSSVSNSNPNPNVPEKRESITSDPCTQFTSDFVSGAIGTPVIKTTNYDHGQSKVCQYFIEGNKMVQISVEYRKVDDQKKANEFLGWQVKKDGSIGMDNFLVWQENHVLNKIYLVIDPNTSVMFSRTAADVVDNEKMITLAKAVASRIGGDNQTANVINEPTKSNAVVPLPRETDIIRNFFMIIGEHRPADAISMMGAALIGDDSKKQAWGVQFNAFESLQVNSIEPSMQEEWSQDRHTYKITLTAKMKSESANAPIPFYGWENGTNIRWVTIVKNGNLWKISGIATGP